MDGRGPFRCPERKFVFFHRLPIFDRLLHLVFNTFLPTPLRTLQCKDQKSKSREIIFTLVFLGLENIATVSLADQLGILAGVLFLSPFLYFLLDYILLDVSFCGYTIELFIHGVVL